MKKFFKSLFCIAIVSVSMLQSCSAFFLGSDKYTKDEYALYGITWEHNTILPDKYYFKGKSISQSDAEKQVNSYWHFEHLKSPSELEFSFLRTIYSTVESIKNHGKDKETQIKELKDTYEKLCNKKFIYCIYSKQFLQERIMNYIKMISSKNDKAS